VLTGHCNRCGKIWTLETAQGVCQWCGSLATCQSTRTQALRSLKSRSNGRKRQAQTHDNGYSQLDGEWLEWLEVAKRYEYRVPSQDRYDIRHTIILELAKARHRDGKPIPLLRAYRIASLTVALYWRQVNKTQVKVCIYDGLPKELHCATCRHNHRSGICPYQASRPVQSLDTETEGERLKDTVADDNGIDIDAWLDAKTWLLGCPVRLVQIAYKRLEGIPLDNKDKCYLQRFRQQEQKRLF
jgi:hypothetical protein